MNEFDRNRTADQPSLDGRVCTSHEGPEPPLNGVDGSGLPATLIGRKVMVHIDNGKIIHAPRYPHTFKPERLTLEEAMLIKAIWDAKGSWPVNRPHRLSPLDGDTGQNL